MTIDNLKSPDLAAPGLTAASRPAAALSPDASEVLRLDDLHISVHDGAALAVRGVSVSIRAGEVVGLVGESGSGKTLTCRAALGAVFQDPASYLNPSITVGNQLAEVLRVKLGLSRRAARQRSIELFTSVGLHHPEQVFHQIPAELSGGMLQRVMIAIAISCDPQLLVADEATTALDVTIQAEVIELLRQLREQRGLAVLFVSHDLAVISELCDRVVVFYAGEVVESGPAEEIIERPRHPYTQALLRVASVGDFRRRELQVIAGQPPQVGADITGCRFAERCPAATAKCRAGDIPPVSVGAQHQVRCVRVHEPQVAGELAAR